MRCSCKECGVYMVHSEDSRLGCVCPDCGARCTACLGTDSVLSREAVLSLKRDPSSEALAKRLVESLDENEEAGD